MFTVGPNLGSFTTIREDVISSLENIYQETRKMTQEAVQKSEERVNNYVKEITRAASPKEQTAVSEDGGGNASSDEKKLAMPLQKSIETPKNPEANCF